MRYIATYYQRVGEIEALNLRIIEADNDDEAWDIAKKLCEEYNYWDWERNDAIYWKLSGLDELDSYRAITKKEVEERMKSLAEIKKEE